jgi:hypothetical protein
VVIKAVLRVIYVLEQKENKITSIEMYCKQGKNESREKLLVFIEKVRNIKIAKYLSHLSCSKQLSSGTAVYHAIMSK